MINRYIPEAVMNTAITSAAAQASALTESTSFESLSASWIEYLQVSATSVKDYTRAVRQFVRYLAEHSVSRPQRSDVIAYRESLRASKKPATVQLYMTAVRLFFRWLETEHLYEDVAKDIKGAKIDRSHKKDYLTADQVKALLRAVTSPRDKAMLAAMVCCGLRCIEVTRLNVEDLTVSAGHTVLMVQGKGHEERTPVKVPQAVERLLRQYLSERKDITEKAPLFTAAGNRNISGRLTTRSVSRIIKELFRTEGLDTPRLTAHSTRHTAVTLALLAGQSLEAVKDFARHASLATTLIYAHDLEHANNQCSDAVGAAIFA